jgi:hypothetical protein
VIGTATGIQTIDHSPLTIDHSTYDMLGRKVANGPCSLSENVALQSMVNAQLKKGVYIRNGKKFIVR